MKGEAIGTLFTSQTTPRESRKRWFLSEKPQGSIIIDEGAVEQLRRKGASLLPVGIKAMEKSFDRGAVIKIFDLQHQLVAVGMANYSSDEIGRIKGIRSTEIEEKLGYSYGDEVVHRDYMVINKEIPVYRVHVLGLGNTPMQSEDGTTKRVRGARVEVSLLKNALEQLNAAQPVSNGPTSNMNPPATSISPATAQMVSPAQQSASPSTPPQQSNPQQQ